jgi:hypothetical protein
VLRGHVRSGRAEVGSLVVDAPRTAHEGATVHAFVRPHDIKIAKPTLGSNEPTTGRVERLKLFCTADMAGDTTSTPRPGTHYWFRANVELHDLAGLQQLVLQDKYRPGRVLLNDGLVVFVNGKPQSWTPSVALGKNYPSNVGMTLDTTVPTDWTFDAYSIPKTDLKEGQNEIAVLFEERHGFGGLGHLVLEARSNRVLYEEPNWERTVEPFFEAFPYLTYYANDGRARAWTSPAWTGPATNSDGHPIPHYVAGQTWFATADLAGSQPEPRPSTYFWFRTTLQIRELAQLQSLRMYDHSSVNDVNKRLCLNEGMIVFVNGVPLMDRMPNVSRGANNPLYGTGLTRDTASPSGWTFDAYSIPVSSLREGSNEIAVLFGECYGAGGICRPVLEATY